VELQVAISDPELRQAPSLSQIVSEITRFEPPGITGLIRIFQSDLHGMICLEFLGKDGTYLPQKGKLVAMTREMLRDAGSSVLPTVRRFLQSIIATYELARMRQ